MNDRQILFHVLKNAAPVCLAVMGLQAGNLIGGSILIETVFAWPGTGFLPEQRRSSAATCRSCRAPRWCWPSSS